MLTFGHDALGRLGGETGPLGTTSSQYDLAGRRTRAPGDTRFQGHNTNSPSWGFFFGVDSAFSAIVQALLGLLG